MKVVCPYCAKELNVSETELAEHGNSMVCPQCLMQFQVSGNEQALARLRESRRQASPAPLHSPAAGNYVYCPHCGKQLPGDGLNYCPYCGNMLREAAYRAAANAVAPPPLPQEAYDEQAAPDAIIHILGCSHTHRERVASDAVAVQAADGVAALDRHQVDDIDERRQAIDAQAADDAAAQGLTRHAVAARVFTQLLVQVPCGGDGRPLVDFEQLEALLDFLGSRLDFCPQRVARRFVHYRRADEPDACLGARLQDPRVYHDVDHCYRPINFDCKDSASRIQNKKNLFFFCVEAPPVFSIYQR